MVLKDGYCKEPAAEVVGGISQLQEYACNSLVLVKTEYLLLVFFATFLGGVLPSIIFRRTRYTSGTSYSNGMFLGAAMSRFLVDSQAAFSKLRGPSNFHAETLAIVGGIPLAVAAEQLIHRTLRRRALPPPPQLGATSDIHHEDSSSAPAVLDQLNKATSSSCDSLLLLLALSLNALFLGFSVGAAGTRSDAWAAMVMVACNSFLIAVAMGLTLLSMQQPLRRCASYAFLVAAAAATGGGVGVVAAGAGRAADWIDAISKGLASGVFLHLGQKVWAT